MMTTSTTALRGAFLATLVMASLSGCGSETPSPTMSPTPSASPSDGVSPVSGYAAPGEVTVDPSLPSAEPLPDGIWDEVEPGWVLVDYMPVVLGLQEEAKDWARPVLEHTRHVVYLISPEGTRYQVAEFNPDFAFEIESWTAGETVAYIQSGTQTWLLDLETGSVSLADVPWNPSDEVRFVSTLPDGTRLWGPVGRGSPYLETGELASPTWSQLDERLSAWTGVVSPDGVYLALGGNGSEILVVKLDDRTTSQTPSLGGDWACFPFEWVETSHLEMYCLSDDEGLEANGMYDVLTGEVVMGEMTDFDPGGSADHGWVDPFVSHSLQLDYGLYAGLYDDGSPRSEGDSSDRSTLGIDDHGVLTSAALLDQAGEPVSCFEVESQVGARLYILANGCEATADETILVYDMDTGSQTVLIGPPLAGPTVEWGATYDPQEVSGMALAVLSWVVAR